LQLIHLYAAFRAENSIYLKKQKMEQKMALLVMDMQSALLGNLPDSATLIRKVAGAITKARDKNIPVIYITVGFRSGLPEINMNNKAFAASKGRFAGIGTDEFMKIDPVLAPATDEITVVKRRVSAFTGSDLEVILRSQSIEHIVLTGIATSGVVLSTVREAADKDYRITVLADCCGDGDDEVQRVLITKVFPRQAEVLMLSEWK
jgi:nicotinamidase-related amidase